MIHKIYRYLLGVALALFIVGCGGSSSSVDHLVEELGIGVDTFDENEKSYLYNLFQTEYYWNDKVSDSFDYTPYTEPQPMIDDLKYSALDRWSFALTRQEYDNMATQQTSGFGFSSDVDFTVYMTNIGSPAESAGLLRGDRITEINGQPITNALLAQASQNINQSTDFTLDRQGFPVALSITSQHYSFSVISYSTVQSPAGSSVGYLRFDEFTENATFELEEAFTFFKTQNINKLVVDLRYNPGGSINTASIFLDKLGGSLNGKVQFSMFWNPQSSSQNETLYFDTDSNSMTPMKLVFLTTGNSASASELAINTMKPYLGNNVAIVGETTHGKPVGMAGRTNGSYIYFLINFMVENSIGFYDYFNGLPPDCAVSDTDYTHALGDPAEALLHEALYYIDNGHC
ncbi:MAG: hypothetical protein DRG30_05520 [Epsilonproteobacteria bacterium]|nr:MAG: hypothetical protein DRG30_05520 [Campylobacterota bacterium]